MAIKITSPINGEQYTLNELIEFKGVADAGIVSIKLVADDKWIVGVATVANGDWSTSYQFNKAGQRRITSQGFDASNKLLSSDAVEIMLHAANKVDTFTFPAPSTVSRVKTLDLWATFYNVHLAKNVSGGNPLLDMSGTTLGHALSAKDWCQAAMEGTISVVDNAGGVVGTYNFAGTGSTPQVDCSTFFPSLDPSVIQGTNRVRFKVSKGPYGEGTAGFILAPYRTIAVDKTEIPIGSVIYIPDARGVQITLPSGALAKHDGYFFAADVGGAIKDNHIDVFLGIPKQNPFGFIKSKQTPTFTAFLVKDTQLEKALAALHM